MAESGCSVGATEPHCRDCWTKSTQNRSHEITRSVTTAPIPDQESTHPGAPGRILHPCEHADLCSQIRFSTLPTWRDIVNAEYTTRTPAFSESNIVTFRGIFFHPPEGECASRRFADCASHPSLINISRAALVLDVPRGPAWYCTAVA